jgi:hypothetical protein
MKFVGGGGGTFAKFDKIGDKFAGTVTGTRELPNKFQNGAMQTIVDLAQKDGTRLSVRLDKRALIDAWSVATGKCGNLIGRYVIFEFEKTYQSKRGGQAGKDITIDVVDVTGTPPAGEPSTGPSAPPVDLLADAYGKVVASKGAEAAAQIRKAVESVEKDVTKQAAMLLKAVGA